MITALAPAGEVVILGFFRLYSERPNGVGIKGVGQLCAFLDGMASFMNQLCLFKTKKTDQPLLHRPHLASPDFIT